MVSSRPSHGIYGALAYVALCLVLMSLRIMPQNMVPGGWPGPDLVLCVTLVWLLRRSEDLPPLLIAAVALAADLIYQRPPGLGAAMTLVACEMLRQRTDPARPLSALAEWGIAAALMISMATLTWGALKLTFAVPPDLGHLLSAAAVTALAYPLVMGALWLTGVRHRTLAGRSTRT